MQTSTIVETKFTCRKARCIDAVEPAWDALVPADCHHLRAGFLRAAERGAVVQNPLYLLFYQSDEPVAAAYLYDIGMDLQGVMPVGWRTFFQPIHAVSAWALTVPLRVCGSPVSSGRSGVWMDPRLSAAERRDLIERIAAEMTASSRWHQLLLFKDFNQEEQTGYAAHLEDFGYFPAAMFPNMVLDVSWPDSAGYLAALRARYRNDLRNDLKAAEGLDWELCDSFAQLAGPAAALYENVLRRAEFKLETLTADFFAVLSDFPQARLLVARERPTGRVVGVNLLMFGSTTTMTTFVGVDYECNESYRLYFNLMERGLLLALDRGCKRYVLGQTSLDFKARLGGRPLPLTGYLRHRFWPVQ